MSRGKALRYVRPKAHNYPWQCFVTEMRLLQKDYGGGIGSSLLTRRFQQPVIQGMRLFAMQTDSDYSILPVLPQRLDSNQRHDTLHLARQHLGTCALRPTVFTVHPDFPYPSWFAKPLRCLTLLTKGRMDVALSGGYYDASEPCRNQNSNRLLPRFIRTALA